MKQCHFKSWSSRAARVASISLLSLSVAVPSLADIPVVKAQESPAALKKQTQSPSADKIYERLKKAVASSGFKDSELGLWVGANVPTGLETYFSSNADTLLIPASLSKLVTAGAVLQALPPGYKYKTQLLFDPKEGKITEGKLPGSLYLKGGGDPSFVNENMWVLVNELTRTGVTSIQGDVVVDDSRFDNVRFGDDRQEERVDRAYDAPVGAMSMNWNSVNVFIRPGDKVGDKLRVVADVPSPYLKVRNETKTVAAGRGKNVSVERTTEKGFNGDVIIVSGAMALDSAEAVVYKNISQPDMWSGYNLVQFLAQRGITVTGKIRSGKTPSNASVLATSESKPLSLIVADMAKWSNNYVAEMLVKTLAAESGQTPADMNTGIAKVREYIESTGIKKDDYVFVNAAGLTRKNKLTARQIGKFLEAVRADFTVFPEFLTSLPMAGVDGTLRSRMKGTVAERWVRAKTGLLTGAVGLAGYAGRPNGEIVAFAFIYNGGGKEDKARQTFDRLAGLIVQE